MKKNKDMSLTIGVHSIAALALVLAPFTTAGAGDGIATSTITSVNDPLPSPGQIASFAAMGSICDQDESAAFACAVSEDVGANNSLPTQQFSPPISHTGRNHIHHITLSVHTQCQSAGAEA